MCVNFTNLNLGYLKDPHMLPKIDNMIDGSSWYEILSFMEAYYGYNKNKMDPLDASVNSFMSNNCNYFYEFLSFSLKNASATYQRLMYVIFSNNIGRNLEFYIDDMVMKTSEDGNHYSNLKDILSLIRKYNMHLNPHQVFI